MIVRRLGYNARQYEMLCMQISTVLGVYYYNLATTLAMCRIIVCHEGIVRTMNVFISNNAALLEDHLKILNSSQINNTNNDCDVCSCGVSALSAIASGHKSGFPHFSWSQWYKVSPSPGKTRNLCLPANKSEPC